MVKPKFGGDQFMDAQHWLFDHLERPPRIERTVPGFKSSATAKPRLSSFLASALATSMGCAASTAIGESRRVPGGEMVEDGCNGASSDSRSPCGHFAVTFTPTNRTLRCDSGGRPMMTAIDECASSKDARRCRGLDGLLLQSSHVEDQETISGGASAISSSFESWTRQGLLHHEQQLEWSALDKFEARVGVAKFKPLLLHKQVNLQNSVSVQNVYVLCNIVKMGASKLMQGRHHGYDHNSRQQTACHTAKRVKLVFCGVHFDARQKLRVGLENFVGL